MSWSRALIAFFTDAFRPPFRTAPWVVLLYSVLSIIYNPDSHFNRWSMPDTDDYMRLLQMMNWVSGQSWFDLSIPHLYPQHIVTMHWARLPDIPLAGVYVVLESLARFFQWNAAKQSIALLTAFFVPCLLMAGLLWLIRTMTIPLVGRSRAAISSFLVILCGQLIFQFLPMRVDHHAYILLSAGTAFFCLQAMALHVRSARMAVIAGLALALGMWNGAEIMPMLVCFCLSLTALVILDRRNLRPSAFFGLTLLASNLVLLFIARAPAQRWAIEYDAFSFFYVLLAALVAAFFVLMFAAASLTKNRAILVSFAVFAGLCGVWALLRQFPDFIFGPYAKTNPVLDAIFFPNIREAVPLYKSWADIGENFTNTPGQSIGGGLYYLGTRMFFPLMGVFISFTMLFSRKASRRRKACWAIGAFFSLSYTLLALIWQVRVITYAQLFSVAPLAWLIVNYLKQLPAHYKGRQLYAYEILTVVTLTIFPTILMPSLISQSRFMPDMLFFLGKGVDSPCRDRTHMSAYLADLAQRNKRSFTIMAPMDYTPELMFQTPNNFIAAPYHRNDRGIMDMVMFFRSRPGDDNARAIARRLDLDYVLLCKASYFQGTLDHAPEVKNVEVSYKNNKLETVPDPDDLKKSSLAMRLTRDIVPNWLEKKDVPLETEFILFEVKKKALGAPIKKQTGTRAKRRNF